jgi:hypothetical protein
MSNIAFEITENRPYIDNEDKNASILDAQMSEMPVACSALKSKRLRTPPRGR